jgi:hypothetical protein
MAHDAREAARAARRAFIDAITAAVVSMVAVVAFIVIMLGLPSVDAMATTPARAMSADVVQVVRALALPADVAFRAVFMAQ